MKVEPYLMFDGRCEEAIEFYKKAVGAKVQMMMRFKDSPAPTPPGSIPPGAENKIMHAAVSIGDSSVMASDGHCTQKAKFDGFTLSLTAANAAEADRLFAALGQGGQVTMPLAKTFFSDKFGMLKDQFGVHWMVLVAPKS